MSGQLTVFSTTLEKLCSKYLIIKKQPLTRLEIQQAPALLEEESRRIFEHLMLFETTAFKIDGDNLPLAMLTKQFGVKVLEGLIEQGAVKFVQWTPLITHLVDNIPGVDPIASGHLNSEQYTDTEKSIDLGLARLTDPLSKRQAKILRKKVADHYIYPDNSLSVRAVDSTKSAYSSGKLAALGLPLDVSLREFPLVKREKLNSIATEISEYKFILDSNMTSLSNFSHFSLLHSSVHAMSRAGQIKENFTKLAELEAVPNLSELYTRIESPLKHATTLRGTRTAREFRRWLAKATTPDHDICKQYVEAIANARGPLDTTSGKIFKTIAVTAISATAGAGAGMVAGALAAGTVAGVVLTPVIEPAVSASLDLLDKFVLEGVTRGWTPRMYFNDIRKLQAREGSVQQK